MSITETETLENLRNRIADLEQRLRDADEVFVAIRNGDVDAVLIEGAGERQVYTLETADRPYRVLIEQMQEGAITLAADGSVLYCNRRFATLMREPLERVVGASVFRFVPDEQRTAFDRLLAESRNGGARGEISLKTADGETLLVQLSVVDVANGNDQPDARLLCCVVTDLTERRTLEEQLRQAQKMEVIGQLTGGVAHDFNNLLMAVLGNLDLLRKRLSPDAPKARRLLDSAIEGAKRGAALTQRLLAFSRRQELRLESVDLATLIRNVNELLERSVGPLVVLRLDLKDGLQPAKVDANQLELALLNLAVNARDAMPEGGTLTIALDEADAWKHGPGLAPGSYLRLRVVDSGSGMDATTLARAIEPFFSTKAFGKGTGLGLSMVHGLAVQLGGTLHLSSTPGQGTTAALWLPIASSPVRAAASVERETHELPPATILVVDDDPLIAMSTVDLLDDLGHTVIEANSGAEALAIVRERGDINLLITDQAMPGMTGLELAQGVRKLRPELPVLLATGYAELPEGMDIDLPRLAKPYQQYQLAAAIANLLHPERV